MEQLKKLETIQRMMTFIDSQAILSPTSNNDESHRFLAHFLLFLNEPCGKLSIGEKCRLISQLLPQISPSFLEEAFVGQPEQEAGLVSDLLWDKQLEKKLVCGNVGLDTQFNDSAFIGLDAMQRANSTLEDFCRSYFMFHGMDVNKPEVIFKYLPVLSFTESYIYQLDSWNEKMVNVQRSTGLDEKSSEDVFIKAFESDPFQPLTLLLEHHGVLTERIREGLRLGEEYWALERKLCTALRQEVEISIDNVMRAIHLKSFDYRVLNLLLYQLRGEQVNDLHMEFLSVSEFLVEISDDLFDYEEDVLENNFNVLRMFASIYGTSAAPTVLAKCIAEAEEKYENLSKALNPELSVNYRRRCEEATKEGGKVSGHPLGSWTIPPLIVDEEHYRSTFRNSP